MTYETTVLVVEDEPLVRFCLSEALRDEGYRVVDVGTVLEAIAVFGDDDHIDALVTDIDMPGGLNGLDLARFVGDLKRGTVTLVTSGGRVLTTADLPAEMRFLPKPYRFDEVYAILKEMLTLNAAAKLQRTG